MKGDFDEFTGTSDPEENCEPDESSSSDDDLGEKHASVEDEKHYGRLLIDPCISAGLTHMKLFPGLGEHAIDVKEALEWQAEQLEKGDTSHLAEILTAQAFTLNSLFQRSVQLANHPEQSVQVSELYYRVAMRAQAQAVKTVQAAVAIHRNNAGKEQATLDVSDAELEDNKGLSSDGETNALPNRSSKAKRKPEKTHAPLDPRSPRKAVPSHSKLEAMDRINGTSNRRR